MKRKLLQFMFAGMCAFTIMASPALSVHAEEGDERAAEEVVSEEFIDDLGEETPAEEASEEAPVEEEANDEAPAEEANEEAERLEESAADDEAPVEDISSDAVSADDDANDTASGWNKDTRGWWYQRSNGTYPVNCWEKIGIYWYHFNASGYRDANKWIGNCYVLEDGKMATSQWVDGDKYWVDSQGNWVKGKYKEGWMDSAAGRWYQNADGTYPKNAWKQIDGYWYYFNGSGYMLKNSWVGNYYVGSDGKMVTNTWIDSKYYIDRNGNWVHAGWVKIDAYNDLCVNGKRVWPTATEWYYFNSNGILQTEKWIGSYYVNDWGQMCTDCWVDNGKYYVGSDGVYVKNCWKKGSEYPYSWYHIGASGLCDTNKWIGNCWVGEDGAMATDCWVDSNKYYVDADGIYVTNQWVSLGYFQPDVHLNASGLVDKNKWVDGYWVGSNGIKVSEAWVDSNKYFTDGDGRKCFNEFVTFENKSAYYIPGKTKPLYGTVSGTKVFFNTKGQIVTSKWVTYEDQKYYANANGVILRDGWYTIAGKKYRFDYYGVLIDQE